MEERRRASSVYGSGRVRQWAWAPAGVDARSAETVGARLSSEMCMSSSRFPTIPAQFLDVPLWGSGPDHSLSVRKTGKTDVFPTPPPGGDHEAQLYLFD